MSKPRVTLVTCADYPNLTEDEAGLPDALAERGMDPKIEIWNDPAVDWQEAGVSVLRSVRDYAVQRDKFLAWTEDVPRLLNHKDIIQWNSDKHYLQELERRGLPTIPTTWLEPSANLSKHQVHTRFPAFGEFVVKPAVSSGARDMGRYTAIKTDSRMEAINHAMDLMGEGKTVMVQRYLEQVDLTGELSVIYFNGLISHSVEKKAMLHHSHRTNDEPQEEIVIGRAGSSEEWGWGEEIRRVLHTYVRDRMGRDLQFLFNRIDMVRDGKGGYYVMEVSMIDPSLYLTKAEGALEAFADAISTKVFW